MVDSTSSSGNSKERSVYYYNSAVKIMDYKISAVDVHGTYFNCIS